MQTGVIKIPDAVVVMKPTEGYLQTDKTNLKAAEANDKLQL